MRLRLALLWLLPCLVSRPAATASPPVLRARDLTVGFGENGDIVSLRDRGGFEYAAPGGMPLFEAILQSDAGHWSKNTARDATSCRVVPEEGGDRRTLRFVYEDFVTNGVHVTVVVSGDFSRDGLSFRLETVMPAGWTFTEITCPYLLLRAALGPDTSDDHLLLPIVDGILLNDVAIRNRKKLVSRYPGQTSMQWMSWYDAAHGLGLAMKDSDGHPKWVGYEYREGDAIHLKWSMLFPKKHVAAFGSPTFEIVHTRGSWQDMAGRYRTWALQQPWVVERHEQELERRASWLSRLDLGLEFDARPQGCGQWLVKPEDVGSYIRSHREGLGAKSVLLVIRNFERHGFYIMPDALPFVPALRTACEQAHRGGDHTFAMTAMLKWATRREEFKTNHYHVLPYTGEDYYRASGGPEATAVSWDGKPVMRKGSASWDPDHARLCVGTAYAEEYVTAFAKELAQAGVDVLEWDQMNGGGATPCYSDRHGHPVGQGKWQTDATHRLFRLSREAGREHNPDFCLSIEDPCEYWLDVVDIPTKRHVFRCTWPGAGKGSITVPAFAYVYRPVCPLIDIDAPCPPNWSVTDLPAGRREAMSGWHRYTSATGIEMLGQLAAIRENRHATARVETVSSLLYGSVPVVHVPAWMHQAGYSGTDSYVMPTHRTIDPEHHRMLRNVLAVATGPGRGVLDHGEMVAARNISTPDPVIALEIRGEQKVEKELPRIIACAYSLNGRVAWFIANVTPQPAEVDVAGILAETQGTISRAWLNGEGVDPAPRGAQYVLPELSVLMLE